MGKGVKTVRGLWAKGGHRGEVPSRSRGDLGLPKMIVLPGTNRSITLKYQCSAAALRRQLHVIYERAHMIYEDLKKHQHTADFL